MPLAAIHVRQLDEAGRQLSLAAVAMRADETDEQLLFCRPGTDPTARRAAVLDAFESVYRMAVAAPEPIPLYVNDQDVRSELERVAASFPAVTLARTPRGSLPALLRVAAESLSAHAAELHALDRMREAQRVASLPELTVATDASKSSAHRGVGIACVSEEGCRQQKVYPQVKSVLAGELLAIRHAITRFPDRDLHILTDSKRALACLAKSRCELLDQHSGEIVNAVTAIHQLEPGRRIRYSWVRAHSGHPLNETADRLAVAARRNHEFNVDADTRTAIADNIVAPLRLARNAA